MIGAVLCRYSTTLILDVSQTGKEKVVSGKHQIKAIAASLRHMGYLYASVANKQPDLPADFSKQELLAIDLIGMRGACRMGEIADYLGVGQSAITSLIDRLEEKELVQRIRGKEDRRVWLVELNAKGKVIFRAQEKNYITLATKMLEPLSDEERDTFVELLERVTSSALAAV